ncbi:MAG: serine/threonine protein kinase [Thermoguttaceae bacterium]|nr:serine/threonine protein kinase [Thermoguttaceae bacterium]
MTQTQEKTTAETASARRGGAAPCPCRVRQWELVALAAEGTLTNVYRARPEGATSDRPAAYAVKVLRAEWEDDPRAIAMLRREALVGRQVVHPHLISVLAAGTSESPRFIVMPWLTGATLASCLARRPQLDPPVAFWIARQAAEALAALDAAGWMHGDVKPSNLFVSPEGHVTLLDLGFARRTGRTERPVERCVVGTCNYLAPETAVASMPVDIRSDLYSLGTVLFEMLAGRLPFVGNDPAEVIRQHRQARPPDLARFAPALPDDAYRLVRALLAKEPLRRPQSPAEVVERLAALEIATFAQRSASGGTP